MFLFFRKYPLTTVCVLAIWYLSFFTPPPTKLDDVVGIDKLFHTAMYGGLCFLWWVEYLYKRRGSICWCTARWWALAIPFAMSGLIELLQEYCTNHRRSGDWWDLAANTLGIVLVYFFVVIFESRLTKDRPS